MKRQSLNLHMLGISMYTKNLYEMFNIDFDGTKNIFATGNKDKNFYSISNSHLLTKRKTGSPTLLFTPRFFYLLYTSNKFFSWSFFYN